MASLPKAKSMGHEIALSIVYTGVMGSNKKHRKQAQAEMTIIRVHEDKISKELEKDMPVTKSTFPYGYKGS